jgi:PQQ-dependent catabolism-associated CXXCW motif protein
MVSMGTTTGSWLHAHSERWNDQLWYRTAWIIFPVFVGLSVFLTGWARSVPQVAPVQEAQKPAEIVEVVAECRTGDNYVQRVTACSTQIAAGKLRGEQLARAYHFRGWAYYRLKQTQLAMQDYNQAISIFSTDPDYFNDRGVLSQDQGDRDSALRDFVQSVSIKPDYALGYANEGYTYRLLHRPDDALGALSTAIGFNPRLVWAYKNRAAVYEEKADWRALYGDANKLIELAPGDRAGYDFRGRAYFEAAQYEPAIADFTSSIAMDPNSLYAYRTRGRAFFMQNQLDKAGADYDAGLRINANDPILLSYIDDLKRRRVANAAPPPAPALGDSYADELSDFGVSSQDELKTNVGSPTPLSIPNGRRVTTSEVSRLLDTEAIIIDVLRDNSGRHITLPGAVYIPGAGDGGNFRDRTQRKLAPVLAQLTFRNADRPLVFLCEGARCWESYNAALRAMHLGYRNVMWYRGGLNSWRSADQKMQPPAEVHSLDD